MNIAVAVLLGTILFSDPPVYTVSEKVDLIELNHYFDSHGGFVLDQAIYYNWSPERLGFEVVDYKLLKSPGQQPRPLDSGSFFSAWHDGHILRSIQTDSYLQTWTQYDPEHRQRERLAHEFRQGLAGVPTVDTPARFRR